MTQLYILTNSDNGENTLATSSSWLVVFSLLALLLCTGIISATIHHGNTESLYELMRTASIIVFFCTCAIYIAVDKDNIDKLVWGLAACCFIYLCIALYQAFSMGTLFFDTQLSYEVKGRLGHRNLMANFMALSMPLYAYIMITARKRWIAYLAGGVLFIVALFLVLLASRVGWFGLMAFIGASATWLLANGKQMAWKRLLLPTGIAILSIGLILGLLFSNHSLSLNIRKKVHSLIDRKQGLNENSYTVNERLVLWRISLYLVKDNPLAGVGPGMWKFNYPYKGLNGTQAQSGKVLFQRPHNDLLWYASEYGLPGLVSFLAVVFFVLFYSIRHINSSQRDQAYISGAGVFIFLVVCFFDFPKERPVHLFLLSFYLAVFAVRIPSVSWSGFAWIKDKYVRITSFILTCAVCLFFIIRISGEYSLNKVLAYRLMHRYPEMKKEISNCQSHLIEYDLTGTPLEFYLGEAAFYENAPDQAIEFFRKALDKNHYHLYSWSDMGSCYWVLHRGKDAFDCWDRAIKIAPDFCEARLNKSIALYQTGEIKAAADNLKFNMLAEDVIIYRKQIIIIYGSYINRLTESMDDPQLYAEMKKIVTTDDWIISLYQKMIKKEDTPAMAAIDEALWVLEKDKKEISASETVRLRKKYSALAQ